MLDAGLEVAEGGHIAMDRVVDSCLGLIGEGVDGILALGSREIVEDLRDVVGTEAARICHLLCKYGEGK